MLRWKILMNAVMAYLSSITPLKVGGVEGWAPLSSSTCRVHALKTEYDQDSSSAALPGALSGSRCDVHSTLKC